jgi:hypothetical protein
MFVFVVVSKTQKAKCIKHLPSSSAEVKKREELDLHSSSGPSWSVPGRNLFVF